VNRRKDALYYTKEKGEVPDWGVANNIIHLVLLFRFIIPKALGGKIMTSQLHMKTLKEKRDLYGTCFAYASLLS
jgi:hypothetical protein